MANAAGLDFALVEAWLHGRSLSRSLPPPVRDHGGLRVDTDLPHERRRYVFPTPVAGLRALAATIDDPAVPLKLCASAQIMRAHLVPGWQLRPPAFMMTRIGAMIGEARVPAGYRLSVVEDGPAIVARVLTGDGALAASGRAVRHADVFVYDQIVTDAGHRRRGLGGAVMLALAAAGRGDAGIQILGATAAGRELYAALGWSVVSDYTTAEFAGNAD